MQYCKQLTDRYDVDVFVAGGGPSGVAAAVAAARMGKRVFLAETSGCFGGMGTTGMVPLLAPFDDGVNVVASGIGYEIRKNISHRIPLNAYWTPIDVEELKREYDRILIEAGVQVSLFTTLCDVISDGPYVTRVVLFAKSGMFTVKAKVYIDCTGDGDLCAFGGGEFEMGDENHQVMPQTLCSLWANVSEITEEPQNKWISKAYNDGVLSQEDHHLPGIRQCGNGIGGGNVGHIYDINPLDEVALTKAMMFGRRSVAEYYDYYRKYLNGYQNIALCVTAPVLGVRESRRILCDYMLNVEDFISRAVFEDEIGRYCYPVDVHVKGTDKVEYEKFENEYYSTLCYEKGESYGIPYRSLIPVSFDNVLVAGRCIGADRKMQASVRVMPGCFITGQAAGTAASLACETGNVRSVEIKAIQRALITLGAYLPNCSLYLNEDGLK